MPHTLHTAQLLQAIADLGIDTPIRRVDITAEGGLTIHLPHTVLNWTPMVPPAVNQVDNSVTTPAPPAPLPPSTVYRLPSTVDDFTAIPYVGQEITLALHNAGYRTFTALVKTDDLALLQLPGIGPFVLSKIRTYLKEHYL